MYVSRPQAQLCCFQCDSLLVCLRRAVYRWGTRCCECSSAGRSASEWSRRRGLSTRPDSRRAEIPAVKAANAGTPWRAASSRYLVPSHAALHTLPGSSAATQAMQHDPEGWHKFLDEGLTIKLPDALHGPCGKREPPLTCCQLHSITDPESALRTTAVGTTRLRQVPTASTLELLTALPGT